jgi:transposase
MWCIKEIDEEYLANMEDVLDFYAQPPDNDAVRLCFDERPCLLVGDVAEPLPMKSDAPKRLDYEYFRLDPCVILLAYNMDTGQRHAKVCDTKTKIDYARFLNEVIEQHYPLAPSIGIVQDNLNTHTKGSFYKTFDAEKARELSQKIQFHFTPKHASWLNMAEIEFSSVSRQCLQRRFADIKTLKTQVEAWERQRNRDAVKIHWSFTVEEARKKLKRHYLNVFELSP